MIAINFQCSECKYEYNEEVGADGKIYRTIGDKAPLGFEILTKTLQSEVASNVVVPSLGLIAMVCPHCGMLMINIPNPHKQALLKGCVILRDQMPKAKLKVEEPPKSDEDPSRKKRGFDFN